MRQRQSGAVRGNKISSGLDGSLAHEGGGKIFAL